MDPKVREILSKARVSAVNYGKAAGKYAGNVVEQAKINLQIFDLNTEIEVAYKEIGKLVYAVHAGEEVCNEAVQAQIEKIDSKTAQIAELRARLSGIKVEKADVAEEICVCDDVESCVEPATPECEEKNGCCCDGEAEEVKSEECCCAEAPAEDAPCCCGEEEKPAEKCCCSDAPNA